MVIVDPLLELSSVTVVPDMYARKAGIMGSINGATNDAMTANRAKSMVTSVISTLFE